MLRKLASPRKRPTPTRTDVNAPNATDLTRSSEGFSQPKPPKESKAKTKKKKKAAFNQAAAQVVSNETKITDSALQATSSSPQQITTRNLRRELLLESDNEEKISTKKPLPSKLMKLPKSEKNRKVVNKVQEHKDHDEDTGINSLKTSVVVESSKPKSRWKIPDLNLTNNIKPSGNHNKRNGSDHREDKTPESSEVLSSPRSESNVSHTNFSSHVWPGKSKRDSSPRALDGDSGSSESEQENQSKVLSPLRRHKPNFVDTLPTTKHPVSTDRLQQRLAQLDVAPANQPEVHLIGEIVCGYGFGSIGGFTCKWRVEYGERWIHIAGNQFGRTQQDYPSTAPWTSDPNVVVWSHPIDLHFATSAFQGWPKLIFQVWRVDSSMELHVVGYGFVPVPFAAGQHKLWVSLWRPLGTSKEELDVQIYGRTPELRSDDVIFNAAWSDRCRLRTVSTGTVLVNLGVLLRHFQAGGIET